MKEKPGVIANSKLRFDSFGDGEILYHKDKGRLPAMGWNSWNAFGSGNTEALTKAMAEKIVELGLDQLGYRYLVLDDGCYKPERVDGLLSNEEVKFPGGFKALADFIHKKGLKFGMYNDIGTNLCAGAAVGTCGHEREDAKTYLDWDVDFIKVDNCYYPWDNATFSNAENVRYTYAPNIQGICLEGMGIKQSFKAEGDGRLVGKGAEWKNHYATGIGTLDGTGPENSPVGEMSGELVFDIDVEKEGKYALTVQYATGREVGIGSWLQVAVGEGTESKIYFDDFLSETESSESFSDSERIPLELKKGRNILRLMNHRRQENTLNSYAALQEGFLQADPKRDVVLSICEWGKTQPQNWGYKVGDSWRILNDITFQVGADQNPGHGDWEGNYTTGVATQYNKAVIMDEFAGLDKGWNDPDMMMIGMDGLDLTMCRTHMTMWCMLNAPLMLGLDLRRVSHGDEIYRIIANEKVIALNQDALGVQAKRIFSTIHTQEPDKEYLRDNDRIDVLAKPLADGSIALSFLNLSRKDKNEKVSVSVERICEFLGKKMVKAEVFAGSYK